MVLKAEEEEEKILHKNLPVLLRIEERPVLLMNMFKGFAMNK